MKYITEINRYSQSTASYDQLYPITKLENVIGLTPSLAPQIIVTADTGSIVTCSDGVTTLTGISDGSVTFNIPNWGVWTVKGEKDGSAIGETEVVVNSVQVYDVTLGDPHTLLLLHGDSIVDSSKYHVPLTNSGVVVSTAQSKFGGKSLYFDGTSQLVIPKQTFVGDFTIDFWAYKEPKETVDFFLGGEKGALFIGYANPNGGALGFGRVQVAWDARHGNVSNDEWHHFALCRKNNTVLLFVDGLEVARADRNVMYFFTLIGSLNGTNFFKGYMDEFRISNVARWTSNFTPPTRPYS